MTDYVPFSPTELVVDGPITVGQGIRFANNPIAITEGAAGAPRIQDAALSTTVTTAGRNWVANRYASQPATGIGQIAMARYTSAGSGLTMNIGDEVNGSELHPCSFDGTVSTSITSLPGRWSCLGFATSFATTPNSSRCGWRRVA